MMVLKGKSALITGAASGIGRPIAQGFARAEARRGPTSVTALVEATGAGQANVSKHLALRRAGAFRRTALG